LTQPVSTPIDYEEVSAAIEAEIEARKLPEFRWDPATEAVEQAEKELEIKVYEHGFPKGN